MIEMQIRITCTVVPHDGETNEDLERSFDATADAFYELSGIWDQSIDFDLSEKTMAFDLSLEAASQVDGVTRAYSCVRSAIHAAGGHTPGWEHQVSMDMHDVENADLPA